MNLENIQYSIMRQLAHVQFILGIGVMTNLASGTIISISTSKGSIILQKEGPPILKSRVQAPVVNTNDRRWNQYETALSNTSPLELLDNMNESSSTARGRTNVANATDIFTATTMSSSFETDELTHFSLANITKEPKNHGSRSVSNNTHHSSHFNSNSNTVLANTRKYIASYEDLRSRFPDRNPFENNTSINMTVPLGDTAFLRCRVKNLGERSISWIRRRDWHILTTGKVTYTNDERFNVLHADGTEEWTLQIKYIQKRDNGTYECQVSTGTGIISKFVNLFITVPVAFILGNGEYHLEQGSNINLVCVIEKSPKPPEFIFWYHNERMINYGNTRDVEIRTEPGTRTQSRLTIRNARVSDSGNYTCKTAHAEPASIFVYVSQASGLISGDKLAATQRRRNFETDSPSPSSSASSREAKIIIIIVMTILLLTPDSVPTAVYTSNSIVAISNVSISLYLSAVLDSCRQVVYYPLRTLCSSFPKCIQDYDYES